MLGARSLFSVASHLEGSARPCRFMCGRGILCVCCTGDRLPPPFALIVARFGHGMFGHGMVSTAWQGQGDLGRQLGMVC